MAFLERTTDPKKLRHWDGDMEADYIYTTGVTGDKFFKELRDNGRFIGTRCEQCDMVYMPPRMYCERCFDKLDEWVPVGNKGTVKTYTVANIGRDGNELENPIIWALINLEGSDTGLIHKLGEIRSEHVKIDMEVEAVLKSKKEREGSVLDIEYFRPVGK